MVSLSQLEERVARRMRAQREAVFGVKAKTGKLNTDGTVNTNVQDGLSAPYIWVRVNGTSEAVPAVNLKVSNQFWDLDVLVVEYPGGWVIDGLDPDVAPQTLPTAAPALNTPDKPQELENTPVRSDRILPGRVRLSEEGGLYVYVELFEHEADTFGGQHVLLVPTATAGAKALIILSCDPATNTITQILGADLDGSYTLDESSVNAVRYDAAAIDSPPGYIRLAAVLLAEGATTVAASDILDIREWLAPSTPPATVQTTDATATTLASIVVAELSAVRVVGQVIGAKAGYSAAAARGFQITARRASGGNVTLVGAAQYDAAIQEDSAGTPAISADVDTGTQSIRIRVTGIAAETWNWKVQYSVLRLVV